MRPDEYLVPADAPVELPAEEHRDTGENDPDMILVTDYLLELLSDEDEARFEQRMASDAAFKARVAPVIAAWQVWPSGDDFALPEAEVSAGWAGVLARAEQMRVATSAGEGKGGEAGDGRSAAAGDIIAARRRLRRWQLAASLLVVVGLPLAAGTGGILFRRTEEAQVHTVEASGPDWPMQRVGDGGWVTLAPGARLTWRDAATATGVRELQLDGHARFRLAKVTDGNYVVVTPSARIVVTGTEFEVEQRDPSTTRVAVTEGRVVLASRGPRGGVTIELRPGEMGEATWDEAPRRVQ